MTHRYKQNLVLAISVPQIEEFEYFSDLLEGKALQKSRDLPGFFFFNQLTKC
jgi:hypothetical protein